MTIEKLDRFPTNVPANQTDEQLIALWLHGRPATTRRTYLDAWQRFSRPLGAVTLGDLQDFADSLAGQSEASRKRIIASIKSLFSFAHKLGYIQFNVAAALKTPKTKDKLAERILSEDQVLRIIYTATGRNAVLLRILYVSAARVSEICALTWADVQPNGDTGQVTLYGKGNKTRAVKLSAPAWAALQSIRPATAQPHDPVFVSQKGGPLDPSTVTRIVRAAARAAGIAGNVSPHWLRHSHASHALDRDASIALVRDTLGHSSLATTSRYTHAKPDDSSGLHLIA